MAACDSARIATRLISSLLIAWEGMGLDVDAIIDRSGVPRDKLDEPDANLSLDEVGQLAIAAFVASGDPLLGLHTAERYKPGSIPVVDYLVASAATLGEAIERYIRYDTLLQNVSVTTLEVDGARATLRHEPTGIAPPNDEASVNALASAVILGRQLTRTPVSLVEVRLMRPPPEDDAEYRRIFDAPVHFGAADNAVVMHSADLGRPLLRADPGMSLALERHAEELLARLPERGRATTATVRRTVATLLPDGNASLSKVAARLGVGERTLRRRLGDEQTTFREVVESVQRELACDHLRRHDLSIDELSLLLGFSDGRALRRAFRRWTGESPAAFRQRHAR